MKEWNELNGDKIERVDNRSLDLSNTFDDALVVISNLIARATTKWTLEETKLFLCSVSKIKTRDCNNWVTIPKKDILEKLKIDPTNGSKLRQMFERVVKKSFVQLDGPTEDDWLDGFLLYQIKSNRKTVSVRFNETYIPLLDHLSSHFTEFYLDYVKDFKRLSSYKLYVYLCSWHDSDYLIQNKKISKAELPKIFGLKEGEYWRNWGKEDARFHWPDFEKRCLNPAIEEINSLKTCDMYIESCDKIKKGKAVLGYDIRYSFVDENGFRKSVSNKTLPKPKTEFDQVETAEGNVVEQGKLF